MAKDLTTQVILEIGLIERLFASYGEVWQSIGNRPPNNVELLALSAILHSFYSGLENIFQMVAKNLDGNVPQGERWHRQLLRQMTEVTERRGVVISHSTEQRLLSYLGFRHLFRHAYSFDLEWDELVKLTQPMAEVWAQIKNDLNAFLESLEKQA